MSNISILKKLLIGAFLSLSFACVQAQFSINLTPQDLTWYTNNHFNLTEEKGSYKIQMDKMPWEAFTLLVNDIDLSSIPVLTFKIKSDAKVDLRIDMIDNDGENYNLLPLVKKVKNKDVFVELIYDFSVIQKSIGKEDISHLLFFVAPGEKHQGVIEIKDLVFHSKGTLGKNWPSKNIVQVASNLNNSEVTIQSRQKQFDQINIYNYLGQLVLSEKIGLTLSETISVEGLKRGVFVLEIKQEDEVFSTSTIIR